MVSSTTRSDEHKRKANRLAQQKFRRQRKDYIAQLECELAMSRAASEELAQHRREMEQSTAQKRVLREILAQITGVLGEFCGLDVTLTPRDTQQSPQSQRTGTHTRPCTLHLEPERHGDKDGDGNGSSNGNAGEGEESGLDEEEARGQSSSSASPAQPRSLSKDCADIEPLADPDDNTDLLHATYSNMLDYDFDWALAETGTPLSICHVPSLPGNVCSPMPPPMPSPMYSQTLASPPASDKAELVSIMFRRQVGHVMDASLAAFEAGTVNLELFESQLVQGLADAIFNIQQLSARMLNIQAMSMCGGSAWLVWQVVKSLCVLPRLVYSGVHAKALEAQFDSDIFRDTMPDWLRPTELQLSIEHHPAIDYLPWPRLRDALVIGTDCTSIDDVLVNIMHRQVPTGADTDRIIQPNVAVVDIRPTLTSKENRSFQDSFYSTLSMYTLRPASTLPDQAATSYFIDQVV